MTAHVELASQTAFEARLEDYSDLRCRGLTRAESARRMGISARTAERYEAALRQRQQEGNQP